MVSASLRLGADIPGVDILAPLVIGCMVLASLCLGFLICKVGLSQVSEMMHVERRSWPHCTVRTCI